MHLRKRWIGFVLGGLWMLISLACTINLGGPTPPAPLPTPDPNALQNLEDTWTQAVEASLDGHVTVTITQEQLTALLAAKLAADPEALFQHPQVVLENNEMVIYGQVQKGNVVANVRMVITVSVDDEGKPEFALASADFGPWPAPDGLLEAISGMLNEAFTGAIGPVATGIRIESITMSQGAMTIQGRIR
ncbi:MAG: hypothetical protein GXO56_03525 [Chloroflexi bacterium]|nr:hypothetical protein [Chloroflexota bacterium]